MARFECFCFLIRLEQLRRMGPNVMQSERIELDLMKACAIQTRKNHRENEETKPRVPRHNRVKL